MKPLRERVPFCKHGSADSNSPELLLCLAEFEKALGEPARYSSGYRCAVCNKSVGGKAGSSHLNGTAADMPCNTSALRFKLLSALFKCGMPRVGIADDHIHVDVDLLKIGCVLWLE